MLDKKLKFSLIIALIIGLVATYWGWVGMKKYQEEQLELKPVVVTTKNIKADVVIGEEDIKIENISSRFIDEYSATNLEEVKGKVSSVDLFAGKSIDLRNIREEPKEDIGNKNKIGVYIDAARSSGVNEGDIVDVYWINNNAIAQPASLIASNARVWKLLNDKGEEITANNGSVVTSTIKYSNEIPRIAYLLVTPEETPYVIQGAASGNSNIALAKKDKVTEVNVLVPNMELGGEVDEVENTSGIN